MDASTCRCLPRDLAGCRLKSSRRHACPCPAAQVVEPPVKVKAGATEGEGGGGASGCDDDDDEDDGDDEDEGAALGEDDYLCAKMHLVRPRLWTWMWAVQMDAGSTKGCG